MQDEDILAGIRDIVEKLLRRPNIVLCRETVASDVDGWDSLSHALIVLRTEKMFGVKLDTGAVGGIKSVGELVDLVKKARAT